MRTKILTFAVLIISASAFGQVENNSKDRNRFGVRAGLNYSNIIYGGDVDFKSKVGFSLGGTYNLVSGKKLTLPIELLYNKVGSSTEYADYNFSLMNINIMVNYYTSKNLFLEGGLVTGLYLSAKEEVKATNSSNNILTNDVTPVDVSIGLGIGYEFTNRTLVNIRYSYGVIPLFINDDNSSLLSNLSLNFGYSF